RVTRRTNALARRHWGRECFATDSEEFVQRDELVALLSKLRNESANSGNRLRPVSAAVVADDDLADSARDARDGLVHDGIGVRGFPVARVDVCANVEIVMLERNPEHRQIGLLLEIDV